MKSKILIPLVIIIPLLFSCKDKPCDVNTSSLLQVGFYAYPRKSSLPDILDTLSIYGMGKTGYFLYKDSSVSSLYLPLSMNMNSSSFVIWNKFKRNGNYDSLPDTLTLNYNRHLQYISKECGFATIFNITNVNVTRHFFDSLSVTNSTVTTSYGENIRIFF
jgi:hypothetical protein